MGAAGETFEVGDPSVHVRGANDPDAIEPQSYTVASGDLSTDPLHLRYQVLRPSGSARSTSSLINQPPHALWIMNVAPAGLMKNSAP